MLVFIASFLAAALIAFVQTTNWLLLGAIIKPNLILATLIVLALINPSWIRRAVLVAAAALILKFTPGFAIADLIFVSAALLSILLLDFLPWQGSVNLFTAVVAGTVIMNLQHLALLPLAYEIILNLLIAFILYTLLKLIDVPQVNLQRGRF